MMKKYELLYRLTPNNFNFSSEFTLKTCSNSPQHSMFKATLKTSKNKSEKLALAKSKKRVLGENFIKSLIYKLACEKNKLEILIEIKSVFYTNIDKKFENFSVFIQKNIKGWLTRLRYEKIIIENSRRITNNLLKDLTDTVKKIYYIGKVINIAANKIQTEFKNSKFKTTQKNVLRRMKTNHTTLGYFTRALVCKYLLMTNKESRKSLILKKIKKKIAVDMKKKLSKLQSTPGKISPRKRNSEILDEFKVSEEFARPSNSKKFTIQEIDSSSSKSSIDQVDLDKLKMSLVSYYIRPQLLSEGIPVLVERKRNSRIWVQKIDESSGNLSLELKNDANTHFNIPITQNNNNTIPRSRKNSVDVLSLLL